MDAIIKERRSQLRVIFLITGAVIISIFILGLMPLLLSQTRLDKDRFGPHHVRLIPLTPEEIIEKREMLNNMEPEPPPPEPEEPEPREESPEISEMEPPDIDMQEPAPLSPEMDTPPEAHVEAPYVNSLVVTSLPVQSSALNLSVHVSITGSALPRISAKSFSKAPMPAKTAAVKTWYDANEVDRMPEGVLTMQPVYPYRARRLTIEGYVQVKFLVDQNGETKELTIIKSEPEGVFEKSVEKTLARWRFKPGIKNGKPVATWVMTTIRFKLENNS